MILNTCKKIDIPPKPSKKAENKILIEMKVEKNKMKPCNDFLRIPLTISDQGP